MDAHFAVSVQIQHLRNIRADDGSISLETAGGDRRRAYSA
jgi:hypothetical protein